MWGKKSRSSMTRALAERALSDALEKRLRYFRETTGTTVSDDGIHFELHVYPFGPHGLSLATKEVEQTEKGRFPDPHVAGWVRLCSEWLTGI